MFSHPYIGSCFDAPKTEGEKYEELCGYHQRREEISNLPIESGWRNYLPCRLYKDFWFPEPILYGVLSLRRKFRPAPSDLFLATFPKSGTTWLKALAFVVCNRSSNSHQYSILSHNPHDCYPNIENFYTKPQVPDLDAMPSPRLLATHSPYSVLPESVRDEDSPCRIVYLCREPKDTVSTYHFVNGLGSDPTNAGRISMEEAVELFCKGRSPYGPVWEHRLEYWRVSQRRPDKVLFLKYEDVKAEPEANVRKLANFMGRPISAEEESNGTVAEMVRLCSFEKLSGLEVNKVGVRVNIGSGMAVKNSLHFRKGKVGDWREHLSAEMAERVDAITKEKLHGTELSHGKEPPDNSSAQGEEMS